MTALKLLSAPPQPRIYWGTLAPWATAGLLIVAAVFLEAYTASVVTQDARRAAEECRKAADELKQERERAALDRQTEQTLRTRAVQQAAEIVILQEKLKAKEPR